MAANFNARRELADAIRTNQVRLDSTEGHNEADRLLGEHMIEISGNPNGSDPTDYMNEDDVATLIEFVNIAVSLGWPGSENIDMLWHHNPRKRAVKNQQRYAKNNLEKALFYTQAKPTLRGYRFGRLRLPLGQPVAIAEDYNLYSLRGREITYSDGLGWGALPDRSYLDEVITRGGPIYYGPTLLTKVLAAKIPRIAP